MEPHLGFTCADPAYSPSSLLPGFMFVHLIAFIVVQRTSLLDVRFRTGTKPSAWNDMIEHDSLVVPLCRLYGGRALVLHGLLCKPPVLCLELSSSLVLMIDSRIFFAPNMFTDHHVLRPRV